MKWTWPGRIAVVFGSVILVTLLLYIWMPEEKLYDEKYGIYRQPWWDFCVKAAITSIIGVLGCYIWAAIADDIKNRN